MFGMGFTEILLIVIVAILALGPEKLPQAMIDVAKFFKSVKRTIDDARSSLDDEMRLSEMKEEALGYKDKIDNAGKDVTTALDYLDDFDFYDDKDEKKDEPKESKKEVASSTYSDEPPKEEKPKKKKKESKPESEDKLA